MSEDIQNDAPIKERLSAEVAQEEFERFAELWDIETDLEDFDGEDLAAFTKIKKAIIRGFKLGFVSLDEEGILIVKLRFSKNSKFDTVKLDPSRGSMLSFDKYKEREQMHRLQAYLAAMSKMAVRDFANIDDRDKKLLINVIQLFLG